MARDVKEHAQDKDGLERNIAKLNDEADKMIAAVKGAGKSHDPGMNAATEAARASPYGFAHIAIIVIAILAIALGVALLV
jgi:hypothetical protein